MWNHLRTLEIIWNPWQSLETICNHWKSFEIICNHCKGSWTNLNWHLAGQRGASCKFIMSACNMQAQLLWKTRACTSQPGKEPPPPPPPQGPCRALLRQDHHWNLQRILDKLELAPDWPILLARIATFHKPCELHRAPATNAMKHFQFSEIVLPKHVQSTLAQFLPQPPDISRILVGY